jgi:hypothetical protein
MVRGERKMQYLVAIHHPVGYDGTKEDAAMGRAISALNQEMVEAGIRVFVGGLQPIGSAKAIRAAAGGALVTDGPYIETKEYIGGFWVLELPGMHEAVEWGRKAQIACRANVEVRQFH